MVASIVVVIAIGIAAALIVPPVKESFRVDACLDSGGQYDYESGECTHVEKPKD